jgi:hypothetical protein
MKKRILPFLFGTLIFLLNIYPVIGAPASEQLDHNPDPFHLPKKKVLNHSAPSVVHVEQWRLTGIIVGKTGGKTAILNNQIVSEGNRVEGGTVYKIEEDRVILKGGFGTKELRILPFLSESQ